VSRQYGTRAALSYVLQSEDRLYVTTDGPFLAACCALDISHSSCDFLSVHMRIQLPCSIASEFHNKVSTSFQFLALLHTWKLAASNPGTGFPRFVEED
jgi:hypothetical protein